MNGPLRITMLGGLQVQQGDRVITRFKSQKIGALLAYLAYHPRQMHAREILIDLHWPESTLEAGRNSLSVALSTLRHQLEPPGTPFNAVLRADRFAVGLNPDAVTTDVAAFEVALGKANHGRSAAEQTECLIEAVDLYAGRLLPGFYGDWIGAAQEHLAGLFLNTVTRLIGLMEEKGDLSEALRYARRAVTLDPLQEQAHEHLIRLLSATGQPGAALRHYKTVERLLEDEIGEEPSAPLRALARRIEKQSGLTAPTSIQAMTASTMASATRSQIVRPSEGPVTLTLLMTDLEGSTPSWDRTGDASRQALDGLQDLLRREFARYGGREVMEAGECSLVAFQSAAKALACSIAGQQAITEYPWPEEIGFLRVRMALHTGDVEYREGAFYGLTLNRVSRILTAGHGGQVLCSEETASLLRRDLDETLRLVDLGVWRLRDLPAPELLFQVEYPGMAEHSFPPLSAQAAHSARLPLRFTRFFGRQEEIARLEEILAPPDLPLSRLVTLTGTGGTGKTRLAIEVAKRLTDAFQGAVWFVALADIADPRLVADTILDSLGIPRSPLQEPLDQVVQALSRQPSLLVLDNFEQLVQGGADVVQALLLRVPSLTVLVTSRQLLGVSGEQEVVVPPLVTPNGGESPEELSLYESVQLFVDRAQAAMPHFQVTSGNAPAVAELCQRLEGIPLAIELAAARALVMTPGQMLTQLAQRYGFLVSRKRDAVERHRTLHAAVDWSYRLLTPEVQRFFARLSVFRGGWTGDAAETVCEEPLALDYLATLRECSLVLTEETEQGMRFRFLETLREYGRDRLAEEERAYIRRRHAKHFLLLAEKHSRAKGARLKNEHGNLRAALRLFQTTDDGEEPGLRMARALWWFWSLGGHWAEGRASFEVALAREGAKKRTKARASALHGVGFLACVQGEYSRAQDCLTESLSILQELGDQHGAAGVMHLLGVVAYYQGDFALAQSFYAPSLAMMQETGDRWGSVPVLQSLGIVAMSRGEYARAQSILEHGLAILQEFDDKGGIASLLLTVGDIAYYQSDYARLQSCAQDSLAISRETGNRWMRSGALSRLGLAACARGDYPRALTYHEESLAIQHEMGDPRGIAASHHALGTLAFRHGDHALARSFYAQSIATWNELGDLGGVASALCSFAYLATALGNPARAASLWGAAEALREGMGYPLPPNEREEYDRTVAEARALAGEDAFSAAWSEGRAMTVKQAIAYALEEGAD